MAVLYDFLEDVKRSSSAAGNFLGLLHVLIGRRVARQDGTVISTGLTWRQVGSALKKVRWEKAAVRDLGLEPAALPPRDRQRYWYAAIAQAHVDSPRPSKPATAWPRPFSPLVMSSALPPPREGQVPGLSRCHPPMAPITSPGVSGLAIPSFAPV